MEDGVIEDLVGIWYSIPEGVRFGIVAAAVGVVLIHREVRRRIT